jgi:hypothetical protein
MMAQLFWMASENQKYWIARDLPIDARVLKPSGIGWKG